MPKETDTAKPEIFYGWFVVIACFFVTMSLGETMWSFGVFFKPLESEFHWSRTLVSSGYSAFLIAYFFSSIVAGKISDRYGPRLILIASGALAGLGISLCSQIQSVNELRAFLAVAGLGAGATWSVPTSTVQRWFYGRPRAGLALAVVIAGVGIGALGAFFGTRLLGELIGITTASGNLLAAFVPYLAGYIFDTAGSYSIVFISLAISLLGVSLLSTTLKKPLFL